MLQKNSKINCITCTSKYGSSYWLVYKLYILDILKYQNTAEICFKSKDSKNSYVPVT